MNYRQHILNLSLPQAVLRKNEGETIHPALSFRACSLHHAITLDSGLPSDFVPFWECGVVISGYDLRNRLYQRLSLEAPNAPYASFACFAHLFADLVVDLWEDEICDEDIHEVARLFSMPSVSSILVLLAEGPSGD